MNGLMQRLETADKLHEEFIDRFGRFKEWVDSKPLNGRGSPFEAVVRISNALDDAAWVAEHFIYLMQLNAEGKPPPGVTIPGYKYPTVLGRSVLWPIGGGPLTYEHVARVIQNLRAASAALESNIKALIEYPKSREHKLLPRRLSNVLEIVDACGKGLRAIMLAEGHVFGPESKLSKG